MFKCFYLSVLKLRIWKYSFSSSLSVKYHRNFMFCPVDKNPGNISKFCQIFVPCPHQSGNNFIIITISCGNILIWCKLIIFFHVWIANKLVAQWVQFVKWKSNVKQGGTWLRCPPAPFYDEIMIYSSTGAFFYDMLAGVDPPILVDRDGSIPPEGHLLPLSPPHRSVTPLTAHFGVKYLF